MWRETAFVILPVNAIIINVIIGQLNWSAVLMLFLPGS